MTSRFRAVLAAIALLAVLPAPARHAVTYAQGGQPPGRSIGTISTRGDLIVLELNEGALGTANMFDLEKRTVRFSPAPAAIGRKRPRCGGMRNSAPR